MKRKKGFSGYNKYGYIFSIPFVIAFLIFSLYPILYTAVIGFTDLKGMGMTDFHILEDPLLNFKNILSSETFKTALVNTFRMWICNFIPQMLTALILSAIFTFNKIKGMRFFRAAFYLPNLITAASIGLLFNLLFNGDKSVANYILVGL